VEITGSNLAQPTGSWLDADFNNGSARTSLGGSSVSINGKPGFISYISPVQINLQAPADPSTGALPVTVTNCAGTSNPVNGPNLQKIAMAPGLLAPPTNISPYFTAGGKQYLVATFGFQYLFVGNANSQAVADGIGNLFVPAKPKDSILLYGIGLGDTSPANTPGVIASGQEVLNAPVTVNFGSTPATVNRVAMYPTFVGLYYIIVTVPATLADGDYQINVTVNGQPMQTPSPLFLTVHH
jgi:uncharacterized protein (TIGR03437 family)